MKSIPVTFIRIASIRIYPIDLTQTKPNGTRITYIALQNQSHIKEKKLYHIQILF